MPSGPPAGTGILRAPGVPPQEVPLMSIQKDAPAGTRVEVGPITPAKGVADVLMGSIGIVVRRRGRVGRCSGPCSAGSWCW